MPLTNNIGYLLQRLDLCLTRQSDQVLQEQLGIGLAQFKILMILQTQPNTLQKRVAESLGQTEASVSRQIKLLLGLGYLESFTNPNNRREHITRLTTRGLRITEKSLEILNRYHAPMFARLSEKQQTQLYESLSVMYDYAGGVNQFISHK